MSHSFSRVVAKEKLRFPETDSFRNNSTAAWRVVFGPAGFPVFLFCDNLPQNRPGTEPPLRRRRDILKAGGLNFQQTKRVGPAAS